MSANNTSTLNTACVDLDITVSIAHNNQEIQEAMDFCGKKYEDAYQTSWEIPPDILFVAKKGEQIVSTLGLEIGSLHDHIGAENYFHLTPKMKEFIENNRSNLAEAGRFSSINKSGAKAVFHAAISYCYQKDINYLFAWANPNIYTHLANNAKIPFWVIEDIELNIDFIKKDTGWRTPPTGFFIRDEPPRLLLSVLPFWEMVNHNLSNDYGKELFFNR
ncbi:MULTISPECIES: thermostable hemolysin [unclassified Bacillus cereus group]|uniref:thermostable hemolysin n=1 Tax=unclassified Bacillus cereus group TaxID=2750818 RepID=UPI001F5A0CD7|nr:MULTISPECIES: thermostable hemolysin [unclassified Bacillus cereus group]